MTETFIRFSLFIGIVLLFAIVSVLAQKFPIIRAFLSLLRKLLIFLLLILLGGFLIFAHSFLACIIIGLAAFYVPESHYLYAGEPINPLLVVKVVYMLFIGMVKLPFIIKMRTIAGNLYFISHYVQIKQVCRTLHE